MEDSGALGIGLVGGVVWLAIVVFLIASGWKIFTKAGKPGWAVIVPIYNIIVMLEIVGRPIWWVVLCLIPFVGFIVGILIAVDLAKAFGKSVVFAVGLILLPFIFSPILGFGNATYSKPESA